MIKGPTICLLYLVDIIQFFMQLCVNYLNKHVVAYTREGRVLTCMVPVYYGMPIFSEEVFDTVTRKSIK